jgi:hypothetical protein
MSIQYLYVHFEDETGTPIACNVLADGQAEGPANKLIMLEVGTYMISLDSQRAYQPAQIPLALGGTSQTRPKVLVFQLAGAGKPGA